MRRSREEFTQEVFLRSEKRIEEREKRHALVGMSSVFVSFVLILGVAIGYNPPITFGDKVVSVIAYDKEESRSYYANEMESIEKLLEQLGSYVEVVIPDKSQYTEENASHYFIFEDINEKERTYYLYEDGTLLTSDGLTYKLDEAQKKELVGDVNETFYWSQDGAIIQYEQLLKNLAKKYPGTINGQPLYGDVFGGAYINDYGDLVVLLVEITPESIKEIQEACRCKNIIVEKCEFSYKELITVNEKLSNAMKADEEHCLWIEGMAVKIRESRVKILVRKLTKEKEAAIRAVVDSPCMVIEEIGSKVVKSPLAEEDMNQLSGAVMHIEEKSVTPTGCEVQFSYTGEGELIYNPAKYIIEKYNSEEKTWYRITCYAHVVTLEAQCFSAERTVTQVYDWEYAYEILPEGRYRLLVEVQDYRAPGDYDEYILGTEFIVE